MPWYDLASCGWMVQVIVLKKLSNEKARRHLQSYMHYLEN